jgi:predicted membrane protein (TIGR00267 family)
VETEDRSFGPFAQGIDHIREYIHIADIAEIVRRYFAMNAFDGVLTTIGILMGSYIGGVRDARSVIHIGVATSISMGISGLWGAYLTETAERQRELVELERLSFTDQRKTKIGRASRMAVVIVALVDGLAPCLAALVVLIPLFVARLIGNILVSYALSLALALLSLFGLGMFLGRISGRSLIGYGLRTLVAGLASIALSFLLDRTGI